MSAVAVQEIVAEATGRPGTTSLILTAFGIFHAPLTLLLTGLVPIAFWA